LYEGLIHAFEADHVLAVTNIVSQREKVFPALKDGVFWGLGHTSTIFIIGILMILFKINIPENSFVHVHLTGKNLHKTSYGIGLVHGLAGSGALVVLVMTQIESMTGSILYLVIFGLGSIVGMTLIAGVFSIPFFLITFVAC
jgi:high-affinity nickel permease